MRPLRFALPFLALCSSLLAAAPTLAPDPAAPARSPFQVLRPADFAPHIQRLNAMTAETVVNAVPDAQAWDWLAANIPLFSCPDQSVEEIYYFRWWSMRKHLIRTPSGFAFTEFLQRNDPISSAVGHHVREGRWLRDPQFIDDYARYWLRGGPDGAIHPRLHNYSEWLAYALYERYLVNGDTAYLTGSLDDLIRDFELWEKEKALPSGLFWQYDVRDAMEESISGSRWLKHVRPPLNSYMYGNARAIAAIARLAGRADVARAYDAKATRLRELVQTSLWDPEAKFFKVRLEVLPEHAAAAEQAASTHARAAKAAAAKGTPAPAAPPPPPGPYYTTLADVREAIGFIPWYFNLPEPGRGFEAAWRQFTDDQGFHAPFGLTTAERRHPRFRSHGTGTCEWDGAIWPYASAQTLTAALNVLRDYPDAPFTARDWADAFFTYTRAHRDAEGKPYIGEYQDEKTGAWIKVKRPERSRYYHHSTYADLLINGLVGLRPRADDTVEVAPTLPADTWDWFCLDGVGYHGRILTIVWDRTGQRFGRGAGLTILANNLVIARSPTLQRVTGKLP
ncbi:glycosyl hydrolase family 65 protein [Opitutus sp. ER46]|uniref:MGH1-like glycoside hydrolase domain-containing protein n=1 Tax=Opitutus sp. ER46 TaxID=2161864 RepID=UPI000D3105AF|nr:glycosyl hydrolase family 65 protein [Opitutus sp. ER46]PTX92511.1 glycoside hydrolase [Opitutus sp. ER46]